MQTSRVTLWPSRSAPIHYKTSVFGSLPPLGKSSFSSTFNIEVAVYAEFFGIRLNSLTVVSAERESTRTESSTCDQRSPYLLPAIRKGLRTVLSKHQSASIFEVLARTRSLVGTLLVAFS